MKHTLIIGLMLLIALSIVVATDDPLLQPYSDTFTPDEEVGMSLSTVKTNLGIKSCYQPDNYNTKECQYIYYCIAILPKDSTSVYEATLRECKDVTELSTVTLQVNNFVPPKGILYYVVTFFTILDYDYNTATEKWGYVASIPTTKNGKTYVNRHSLRSVCSEGQMLDQTATGWKCYIAERACLDTSNTGLCTNAYTLYVLDKNGDGVVDNNELKNGANYCADRGTTAYPEGDKICDKVVDLQCADICSKYSTDGKTCTINAPNGLCDEWDKAVLFGCWDDVLSPNSKICDSIDNSLCSKEYNPICVGGQGGTTYPNECFAQGQGYTSSDWNIGECTPDILQCYTVNDCPDAAVCLGGSTAGITKMCLGNLCSYTGACGNMACATNADCAPLNANPVCIGVEATCQGGVCVLDGQCLTQPNPGGGTGKSIWDIIAEIWNTFWAWLISFFS